MLDTELRCEGDLQPPTQVSLDRVVLLRYDKTDCRFNVVEGEWIETSLRRPPPGYAPEKWIRKPPAAVSPLFGKLLHGPQGLGANVQCR